MDDLAIWRVNLMPSWWDRCNNSKPTQVTTSLPGNQGSSILRSTRLKMEIISDQLMPRRGGSSGDVLRNTANRSCDPRPTIGGGGDFESANCVSEHVASDLHLAP